MYPDTTYEITATDSGARVLRFEPLTPPPMAPAEIPPGVEMVTLPGGIRTLAYTHSQDAHTAPVAPASAAPVPVWAKTTALLAPTVGGGIAAGGVGLSYAAPGLIAMSHALWSAAALIATSTLAVAALLWAARNRRGANATAPTQITQNIHAGGLFGRANGTINHQ